MSCTCDEWHGLYSEGWGDNIVSDAFGHPAKFRPMMIRHIYAHMIDEGWLKPGDVVLDPFAGVALGALYAMCNGLHWIGIELEQRFCDVGSGVDCTGISAADWVRFHGRWSRAARLEGRAWCPRCLAEAARIDEALPDMRLFTDRPSASYRRNSGQIPSTEPHHYRGNLDLWRAMGLSGSAVLLQGDSRELLRVVAEHAQAAVSSPPYSSIRQDGGGIAKEGEGGYAAYTDEPADYWHTQRDRRNLGNLREPQGDFAAAVSSPPYVEGCQHTGGDDLHPEHIEGGKRGVAIGYSAAVSSPPFEDAVGSDDPDKRGGLYRDPKRSGDISLTATYGDTPGQLGAMKGGFEGAVSSPPYPQAQEGGGIAKKGTPAQINECPGGSVAPVCPMGYGEAAGQLGQMPANDFEGVVSSPPFGAAETRDRSPYQGGYVGDMMSRAYTQDRQGASEGNLAQMETNDFEAVVSSPPYEGSLDHAPGNKSWREEPTETQRRHGNKGYSGQVLKTEDYGDTEGQLGSEHADTFWQAARAIVEQVYAALVPGGHAAWVVKAFVRDKQIVDFPGQWRQLCEAVGFRTLHEHHAMLVEDQGTQLGFFENERLVKERKSFFRRLAESKGSPKIDYEVVWCMEKPKKETKVLYRGYLIEVDEDEHGWWWRIYDTDGCQLEGKECRGPFLDPYAAQEDAQRVIEDLKGE